MKMNYWLLPGLFSLMFLLTGCKQAAEPGNVTFTDAERTAIASTAQAYVIQTAQAAAQTPTSIPPTSTPKVSPISGSALAPQADGSTLFIDHRAGIQVLIPAEWLTLRVNEDEFYKAFTNEMVAQHQVLIDHLTGIQDASIDQFRLDAIDLRPGHVLENSFTNIQVIFQKDDIRTLEKWRQAERNKKSPLKGYKFLTSKITKLENGTDVLIIEESWDAAGGIKIYYRGVFFVLSSGTVVLDFYCDQAYKDELLPDFEQVVNSLSSINP